jgi:hypothetical protein
MTSTSKKLIGFYQGWAERGGLRTSVLRQHNNCVCEYDHHDGRNGSNKFNGGQMKSVDCEHWWWYWRLRVREITWAVCLKRPVLYMRRKPNRVRMSWPNTQQMMATRFVFESKLLIATGNAFEVSPDVDPAVLEWRIFPKRTGKPLPVNDVSCLSWQEWRYRLAWIYYTAVFVSPDSPEIFDGDSRSHVWFK